MTYSQAISLQFFGRIGAYAWGVPAFAGKLIVWDAPVYLWDTIMGNEREDKDQEEKPT